MTDKIAAAVERLGGPGAEFEAMEVGEELAAVFVAAAKYRSIRRDYDDFDGDKRSIAEHLGKAECELDAALSRCADAVMQ